MNDKNQYLSFVYLQAHPSLPDRSPEKLSKLSLFPGLSGSEF
ncbi:MAG TPA: hypothetical protein V6D10_03290 [Trichocoleus sp.]|jgi:hypothetical protein